MTFDIVSVLILPLFVSTSANIGFAPHLITEETDAIKLLGVTITSSFFLISILFKAISKASVPLETAIEYLVFAKFENSFSNNLPSLPVQ